MSSQILHWYESPAAPPRDRKPSRNPRRPRRGLGLVELMISMSIVASLLTATAAAVNAAFRAYEVNQEQAALLSKARVALAFISTSIRGTQLHAPDTAALRTQFAGGQTVTDTGLDMYDDADNLVRIYYDTINKKLMVTNPRGTFTMARGVEAFNLTLEPMRSATSIKTGGSWDLLKRATITITVRTATSTGPGESTGQQTLTLSGSVMPRKNAW
jgi:prepilin-type N-terminal cleavage/methylation domain-containing protein